jgi:uncharacterized protein YbjT (DUF2867 family)
MQRALVAGATGYLGRHVVAEMKRRGIWVRALARPEKEVPGADEVLHAEATRGEALAGACEGVDVVFSSLGITRQTDRVTYEDVDYGANRNLLKEAERAGVSRFGFVSVVAPELFPNNPMVAARERFVRELEASNVPSTVVRATGFFSDLEEVFQMAQHGTVYLFDAGEHRMNPVHGADLAAAVLDLMDAGLADVNVGGPDVLTYREIGELAFAALGRSPRIRTVPRWLSSAALCLVRPFSRHWHTVGTFMREATTHDVLGDQRGSRHLREHFEKMAERAPA